MKRTELGRNKPLTATKGLTVKKGLEAHKVLPRGAGLARRPPAPRGDQVPRQRSKPPPSPARAAQLTAWRDLQDAALLRDGYRCAWCGASDVRLEVHHRAGKGIGGSRELDHLANLVSLHGWGNHTGCHGRAHGAAVGDREAALAAGMTLPRGTDPSTVPVLYHDGLWLLDDSGSRVSCETPGCGPLLGNHTGDNSAGSYPAW